MAQQDRWARARPPQDAPPHGSRERSPAVRRHVPLGQADDVAMADRLCPRPSIASTILRISRYLVVANRSELPASSEMVLPA